jgi:hypothetical protein
LFLTASDSASDSQKDSSSEISYKREDFTDDVFLKIRDDLQKLERFRRDLEEFIDATPEGSQDSGSKTND